MSKQDALGEEPFSFQQTKNGLVQIAYRGRVVTTLAGKEASRFLSKVESAASSEAQLAMAKATGHFKHGNEKLAREKASKR